MDRSDFETLSLFLKRHSGLSLAPGKVPWAEARLKPLAQRYGYAGVARLTRALETAGGELRDAVAEAMATHDTSFFRDPGLLAMFREEWLPALHRKRPPTRPIRLWSAGCSRGQEPYSLAMILDSLSELSQRTVEILATDISAAVIARATSGLYSEYEVQRGLPIAMLGKYFQNEHGAWRVARGLRKRVRFRVSNLLEAFDAFGTFDVIFCRNVLIYFDAATKDAVLSRFSGALAPDGTLVLGEAETAMGIGNGLSPMQGMPGVFTRLETARARRLAAS